MTRLARRLGHIFGLGPVFIQSGHTVARTPTIAGHYADRGAMGPRRALLSALYLD